MGLYVYSYGLIDLLKRSALDRLPLSQTAMPAPWTMQAGMRIPTNER